MCRWGPTPLRRIVFEKIANEKGSVQKKGLMNLLQLSDDA